MKQSTFSAEKKAKQFLNLLQGYTKGIRMTAILVLLLMGVSNAWGASPIYSIGDVYVTGSMNDWSTNSSNWKLGSGNHCTKTFYVKESDTNYTFKLYLKSGYYTVNGYWFTKTTSGPANSLSTSGDNMQIQTKDINAASGYVKLDFDFWGEYSGDSKLSVTQSAVAALSPSLSASSTSLIKSGTSTITASCSGGSGSYTYTYKVTCDGSEVTNTTLSATTGASVTFTAPSVVTGKKTYTITVTAKDSHALLSGLATKTATKTITVEEAHNVTVSYKYGSTTIKDNTTTSNVKYETASSITAPAIDGYKFANWTLGTGISSTNANTANPIKITTRSSGTYTLTANYTEDLTSNWKLIGDNQTNSPFGDDYTYSNGKAMTKKSGHSTESNVYITLDIKHLPTSYYGFKVATSNSDNDKYGYGTGEGYYITFNRSASNTQKQVYNGSQHELKFIPDALGEYEFRVNYPSNKYVYVTFPTAYTVTFGKGTGGSSVTAKYSNTSFSSGKKVQSGKTVTFTQTPSAGYAFKEWNTKSDGTGTQLSTNATYTHTVAATNTVYAIYTKKPDKTIYLEPTGHWNSDKAVFQAHVWQTGKTGVNLKMEGIGDPSHADGDNKSPHRYYKVKVPAEYDKILFFRKDNFATANENAWNKTGDLTIPTDDKVLYTITSAGKGKAEDYDPAATGVWKAPNFIYTITLGYCDFGTYGIKYNGQSYFSKPKNNVTIDVPAGAQIEILEGQPHSNAYTGDVIKSKPTKEKLTIGQALTINGDVTLDDNFITTTEHVVYLGIPDAINTAEIWNKEGKANFIYTWDTYASYGLVASTRSFRIDALGITYYEFTIPAERHSFRFQRKSSLNDNGSPYCESVSLEHEIPLTDVNCFTLKNEKDDNNRYKGTWGTLPAQQGDHRLLYIEQKVVKLENGHPETTVTKAHPSDIIRQGDNRTTYSLHIYNKVEDDKNGMNDPEILLQECTGYDGVNPIWTTRERHMVFGPLHADFGMAAMPGRRDAAGVPDAVLRYDNGIENIKNDINTTDPRFVDDQASGVWNFIVTRDGSKNFEALDLTQTARYTGDYYVRTDCADGGWDMYTAGDNHMHFSAVSKAHSNYSHYFCKWVESDHNVNVKYTIANDYGIAISDTLEADKTDLWGNELANKMVGDNQLLPANANVRFSWNEKTNGLHRAYIAGATDAEDRFLVLEGKATELYDEDGAPLTQGAADSDRYGLNANEEIFSDISNWVYQTDVQMIPNASLKVTAKYYNQTQYFIGGKADEYSNTILQGTGSQKYLIRLLYDFKTNELISAYVPGNNTNIEAIQTNLMLIREGNNPATQLNFTTNDMVEEGRTAYGVIEFPYELLTGSGDIYQRSLYWISFPFDVNLQDAFGVGQYGVHWLIQEYDGARRAEEGLWAESDSFWKLHWDQNITLKAGFGYVIELDIAKICSDYLETFKKSGDCVALYFPSAQPISGDIVKYPESNDVSVTIPAHQCTIPIRDTPFGNRQIRDSHWNVIGVPSYVNAGADFSHSISARPEENKLKFYYRWITYDTYEVVESKADNTYAEDFQSMFAYMVQYEGNLTWKSVVNEKTPQGLAARQNSDTQKEHNLRLELQQNGAELDRTFITMQEDDVTAAFDFNYDLCKVNNGGANIYSLIATDTYPIQVAGNVLPVENNVIPVGVIIRTAGEYTFAMPEGTDGIVVELIDYEANTTTNLLFNDYTVNLGKGTFENRFALSVKPDKTATSLENIFNEATGDEVKKFIIDGVLYMQKDGVLYDAQGHIVR